MPAALKATLTGLLQPRGHSFKVTAKGGDRGRVLVQWPMIARFGLLLGLTLGGMLYGSLADYTPERQEASSTAIVVFWSVYNIIVLLLAMAVCVEFPRYRGEERVATGERVRVSAGNCSFTAPLSDISVTGARIQAPSPGREGDVVRLRLQDIGDIQARIIRDTEDGFAVEFVDAEGQRDALIRKVYCSRYERPAARVHTGHVMRALLARALR